MQPPLVHHLNIRHTTVCTRSERARAWNRGNLSIECSAATVPDLSGTPPPLMAADIGSACDRAPFGAERVPVAAAMSKSVTSPTTKESISRGSSSSSNSEKKQKAKFKENVKELLRMCT